MLNNVYIHLTIRLILQGTQIVVRFSRDAYVCASRISIRACVHACVRPRGTTKPMAWTGMWVMSVFSSITFKDGDGRPLDMSAGTW